MINTLGDLAAHTVFHEGNPYISGFGAMLLLATLLGINSWIAARYPPLHRLIHRQVRPLARKGRLLPQGLEGLHLSQNELESELRKHGVQRLSETEEVALEPDGSVFGHQESGTGGAAPIAGGTAGGTGQPVGTV